MTLVLPEREFRNPIARAIIEERKRLTLRPQAGREDVARSLGIISARPYQFPRRHRRLPVAPHCRGTALFRRNSEAVPAIQKLLWDTALRVEDGELSLAERNCATPSSV